MGLAYTQLLVVSLIKKKGESSQTKYKRVESTACNELRCPTLYDVIWKTNNL